MILTMLVIHGALMSRNFRGDYATVIPRCIEWRQKLLIPFSFDLRERVECGFGSYHYYHLLILLLIFLNSFNNPDTLITAITHNTLGLLNNLFSLSIPRFSGPTSLHRSPQPSTLPKSPSSPLHQYNRRRNETVQAPVSKCPSHTFERQWWSISRP